MDRPRPPRSTGPALVLLAGLALGRQACSPAGPEGPLEGPHGTGTTAVRALVLPLKALKGRDFRLLEGAGPVMARRLEAARLAAGGRLDEQTLTQVEGVGPVRAARWRRGTQEGPSLAADPALR